MNDRSRKSDAELIVEELRAVRTELRRIADALDQMTCVANPDACDNDDDDDAKLI